MKKREFKVGDRVRVTGEFGGLKFENNVGTIINVEVEWYCVEFDNYINGHNCRGKGKKGHCWYIVKDASDCTIEPFECKDGFKVGDRVRIRKWADMEKEFGLDSVGDIPCRFNFTKAMKILCGTMATIKRIDGDVFKLDTDKEISRIYNFSTDMFEKVETEKVVIYRNGSKVVAKNTGNKLEGVAICSPEDEFDFYTGAGLALKRLAEKELGKTIKSLDEKLKEIKVGDIVIVKNNGNCYTTYHRWFEDYFPELASRYAFCKAAENYKKYKVVAKHEHGWGIPMLYALEDEKEAIYLIGEKGIEKE